MTILNSNQDWPQIYMRRWNAETQCWVFGYEDKSIVDIVLNARDRYYHVNMSCLTTLFAGPRAWRKIEDLFSRDNWVMTETQDIFERRKKEFLGLELILTIDNGLWIM